LRLGLFLLAGQFPGLTEAEALAGAVDNAVAAEQAGLDSVWFAEHHFITYGICPSAVVLAANVLGRTSRISVGTGVCVLSNRHPVALAEESALLDHLSGGRFHLGVGRGGPWVDLEVFGTGLARFEDGFAETLDLLVAGLEQGRIGADAPQSRFFEFRPVPVIPRPLTHPRPPVVVAATTRPTVEVAAERGLPMLLGLHATVDEQRELLDHYARIAEAHGHDPDAVDHIGTALCHLADSRAGAEAELRGPLREWIRTGVGGYVSLSAAPRPRRDPAAYVEHLLAIHPLGTPEECVTHLRKTAAATGIRHVVLMVEGTGDPVRTGQTIHRLGSEVAPELRRASDPPWGATGRGRVASTAVNTPSTATRRALR
jgi:alkanesulfonate monooxygenase SsuD/methylene tetrahydromethanopterin reductase-like flavin-dependent oxidoreductase (luciferase family)